jgi:ABC-type branched-subunit amino acid transport system substrate-binding protein
LKIGMMHVYLEDYEKAVYFFHRVEARYPGTVHAREAGVGKLAVYYKTGDYENVTLHAGNVLAQPLDRGQWIHVNLILGDSYMALKAPMEAYVAYLSAVERAASDEDRKRSLSRLKAAISLLEPPDMMAELARLDGRSPSGYLQFQLGVAYMENGFSEEAAATFSAFRETFPDHEYAAAAAKLLAELEATAVTDRRLIGCLLPLSGKYEQIGHMALEGIEFALSRFARERGASDLRILIQDTASDVMVAENALRSLADAHVSAIIGPIATAETLAPRIEALRIPAITLTQKPGVTEAGDYVFRNFLTPRMQINTLAAYAVNVLRADRFAILYPDEGYGDIYMNLFWDAVMALGGRVVGAEAYDPRKTDFAEPIQKLVGLYYAIPEDLVEEPVLAPQVFLEAEDPEPPPLPADLFLPYDADAWHAELTAAAELHRQAAKRKSDGEGPDPIVDFDALFIPDSPEKAGMILPQLAYYDITGVKLLGTNLWHSDKLLDMARFHVQGAVLPEGFFEDSRKEHVRRFVAEFAAVYGRKSEFIQAVAYDTASILFDLVIRPDIRFRAQLKNALTTLPPFAGVTGTTVFDPSGEAVKDVYLLQARGRNFVEIELPAPFSEGHGLVRSP